MKIAYADPPYIGQAKRHYENHPDYAGEVDHWQLLFDLKEMARVSALWNKARMGKPEETSQWNKAVMYWKDRAETAEQTIADLRKAAE